MIIIKSTVYLLFSAEVDKQKKIRGLDNEDIAKLTGFSPRTITAFLGGYRDSENVANCIAKVLGIER